MARSNSPSRCTPILGPPRLNDLPARLSHALTAYPPEKKYLIGVSGGCDSMVLLHALHTLGYRKLIVCHLNHGLRGASSRADATLVRKAAARLGLDFESSKVAVKPFALSQKYSLETAGRELRFTFFTRCARKHRCPRILLAHHADDQIETGLFNFLRGTGAAGIAGIKPVSRRAGLEIIRPLLGLSRDEISVCAMKKKIPWREDASNTSRTHTRNRLRHDILPAITKALGTSYRTAILRAAEILREEDAWMESLVPPVTKRLSCKELLVMPEASRRRTVLRWLKKRGVPEAGFQETIRTLCLLNDGSGPAKVSLRGNFQARRRTGKIFLERAPS